MSSLIAFFVAALLVVATGAPLAGQLSLGSINVQRDKIPQSGTNGYVASGSKVISDVRLPSLPDQGSPLMSPDVTTKKSGDDILSTLLTTMRSVRVTRGLPENMKVTMDEESATNVRMMMEKINEDLKRDIESKSPKCGSAKITKELDSNNIPSYFYNVKCLQKCGADTKGSRDFKPVELKTMYFQKVDSDEKDRYKIKFRDQVVGCCLEQYDGIVHKSGHTSTPSNRVK